MAYCLDAWPVMYASKHTFSVRLRLGGTSFEKKQACFMWSEDGSAESL